MEKLAVQRGAEGKNSPRGKPWGDIETLLAGADEEKKRMILKIWRAAVLSYPTNKP